MRKNALSVKNFKMANMYTVSSVVERLDDFDFDLDDGLDSDFGREGLRSYLSRAGLDGLEGVQRGDRDKADNEGLHGVVRSIAVMDQPAQPLPLMDKPVLSHGT